MSKLAFEFRDFLKPDPVNIDNSVFRLHYKVTLVVLLTIVFVVGTTQYVGNPIECIHDHGLKRETVNNYCWIHSTYTHVYADDSPSHPGKTLPNALSGAGEKYHKYYQWVGCMFLLQAILFYIPHYLWVDWWEKGRMKDLVMDLTDPIGDPEKKTKRKKLLTDFLTNLNIHSGYASRFSFCELLNLINVIGQIFLLNRFLDDEFTKYGFKIIGILNEDPAYRVDTMDRIFPKLGKCTFNQTGPSGDIVNYDNLCVLPINNINEKLFVFMWAWLLILAGITTITTLGRVLTMSSVKIRTHILYHKSLFNDPQKCEWMTMLLSFSDWFILTQIGSNVDSIIFSELLDDLYGNLSQKKINVIALLHIGTMTRSTNENEYLETTKEETYSCVDAGMENHHLD